MGPLSFLMLSYVFQNPALFVVALTNRAYRVHNADVSQDNQRLEFLGDAVLELVCSRCLYDRFPEAQEGALTVMRTRLTDETALATIARRIQLGPFLRIDPGQENQGARDNDSILSDAVEAVLGAIYLDGGIEAATTVFLRTFAPELDALASFDVNRPVRWNGNPKGHLQQIAATRFHTSPVYTLLTREGPDHAPTFTVEARLSDQWVAQGTGPSRQKAEFAAAAALLALLEAPSKA